MYKTETSIEHGVGATDPVVKVIAGPCVGYKDADGNIHNSFHGYIAHLFYESGRKGEEFHQYSRLEVMATDAKVTPFDPDAKEVQDAVQRFLQQAYKGAEVVVARSSFSCEGCDTNQQHENRRIVRAQAQIRTRRLARE